MSEVIRIKPDPYPQQLAILEAPERFKVLACGRRWGKTVLAAMMAIDVAARGGFAWWVAPTYPLASIGWEVMRQVAAQIPGVVIREMDRSATFPGGGTLQAKSAHDPDSLRGRGLDFVALDECPLMAERAWTECLRPALADRQGRALFIGTPKGRNWFFQLWLRGQDAKERNWKSWRFASWESPNVTVEEIEEARRVMPERAFRQEFMAEFLEDYGAVFRNVLECATAEAQSTGSETAIGVDLGKYEDFTVITVLDKAGQMLAIDRFNQIDYVLQMERVKAIAARYQPRVVVVERNAAGEPFVEQLARDGLPVYGFATTAANKSLLIDDLSMAFDKREIRILPDPVLTGELQAYTMVRMPSGSFRYSAPEGYHDDAVIALALAWHGLTRVGTRELETMPSIYGSLGQEILTKREEAARVHSDSPLHKKWAQKNFCPQCYEEWAATHGASEDTVS